MARLCQPDHIVWIDGSAEEKDRLVAEATATGEVIPLNQEKHPGCLYHRTALNDVARTEDLTYICTTLPEDAGPMAHPVRPDSYVEINRKWKTGDVVDLVLPKTLRTEPLPDNPNRVALMWGPLVLAGDLGPMPARGRGRREQGERRPERPTAPASFKSQNSVRVVPSDFALIAAMG